MVSKNRSHLFSPRCALLLRRCRQSGAIRSVALPNRISPSIRLSWLMTFTIEIRVIQSRLLLTLPSLWREWVRKNFIHATMPFFSAREMALFLLWNNSPNLLRLYCMPSQRVYMTRRIGFGRQDLHHLQLWGIPRNSMWPNESWTSTTTQDTYTTKQMLALYLSCWLTMAALRAKVF